MDIINHLQAYKEEIIEADNNMEYHSASRVSKILDKIDALIEEIIENEDLLINDN